MLEHIIVTIASAGLIAYAGIILYKGYEELREIRRLLSKKDN